MLVGVLVALGAAGAQGAVHVRGTDWYWGSPWPTNDDLGPVDLLGARGYAIESWPTYRTIQAGGSPHGRLLWTDTRR